VRQHRPFSDGDSARRHVENRVIDNCRGGHLNPARVAEVPARKCLLHGHCHQKALLGVRGTVAALRLVPRLDVVALDTGCCGMAGSFGYERGHYEVSEALAHRVLIPAALALPDARLVAPGFSCRSQVQGLAGLEAAHPIQVIARQLRPADSASPGRGDAPLC